MRYAWCYEEIPASLINLTIAEIEKRLEMEELKLAMKCAPSPAFITLELKNGDVVYVTRKQKWNGKNYTYTVQLLRDEDETCMQVLYQVEYVENNGEYFRPDGYPIVPLFMLAVKIIRLNKYGRR